MFIEHCWWGEFEKNFPEGNLKMKKSVFIPFLPIIRHSNAKLWEENFQEICFKKGYRTLRRVNLNKIALLCWMNLFICKKYNRGGYKIGQFLEKFEILIFLAFLTKTFIVPFFSKICMGLKSTILVLYFPINNIKNGQIEKKVQGVKTKLAKYDKLG